MSDSYIHPTAIIEPNVQIGAKVKIWHFTHVRSGAIIEDDVSLARDVYVDCNVKISKSTRVQNGVSIYHGVHVDPYCFIGPHVIFTNDLRPRAGNRIWEVVPTYLRTGAALGAGAIVRAGIEIGAFSLVGAGAVLTRSIPAFHLVYGNPAAIKGMICCCGRTNLPLGTPILELLKECCCKNLDELAVINAKEYLHTMMQQSQSLKKLGS